MRAIMIICFFWSISTCFAVKKIHLVILHTNDTHSQVEPTERSELKTSNMGGYARRIGLVDSIRNIEKNVLLLDAGDFFQGTPYFNFYHGRIEINAINKMRYDAVTLGNHEFDNGIDTLEVVLRDAKFPVISSTYDFQNTSLKEKIKPYLIIQKFGLRIGIMALNINPEGLITKRNTAGMRFIDPTGEAIRLSDFLRNKKKCDLIICLSHLGDDPQKQSFTDYDIIHNTTNIDVILGGHSHSMVTDAKVKNKLSKNVIIAQVGKSGLYLGRIDLELQK